MKELQEMLKKQIEALIFVSEKPISPREISKILEISEEEVEEIIMELKKEYENRGINLYRINGTYEFGTSPDTAPAVWRLISKKREKLTKSALETLAIIYYHQPITKAEIEAFRGVKVDGIISQLLDKRFIKIVGRKDTIGRPFLYGIGDEFYRYFIVENIENLKK